MAGTKMYRSVLVTVGAAIALLATMLPAGAQGIEGVVVEFDTATLELLDSAGEVTGSAEHSGSVRCYDGRCAQSTQLEFADGRTIQYRFKEVLAFDPQQPHWVVAGDGVISDSDGRQRFSFTAILEPASGDEVSVHYVASTVEATFIVRDAPGTFTPFLRP